MKLRGGTNNFSVVHEQRLFLFCVRFLVRKRNDISTVCFPPQLTSEMTIELLLPHFCLVTKTIVELSSTGVYCQCSSQ